MFVSALTHTNDTDRVRQDPKSEKTSLSKTDCPTNWLIAKLHPQLSKWIQSRSGQTADHF